jgi:hypothetical protein
MSTAPPNVTPCSWSFGPPGGQPEGLLGCPGSRPPAQHVTRHRPATSGAGTGAAARRIRCVPSPRSNWFFTVCDWAVQIADSPSRSHIFPMARNRAAPYFWAAVATVRSPYGDGSFVRPSRARKNQSSSFASSGLRGVAIPSRMRTDTVPPPFETVAARGPEGSTRAASPATRSGAAGTDESPPEPHESRGRQRYDVPRHRAVCRSATSHSNLPLILPTPISSSYLSPLSIILLQ